MQKIVLTILVFLVFLQGFGQKQRKVSTYLSAQFNKTLYDRTKDNNPWGAGFGLQAFFNNRTKFKPTIEFTGDLYLEDDKVLRLNPDGSIPTDYNDVRGMVNVFVGASFHATKYIYASILAGPSFIAGKTSIGIKPSFGVYFSESQKWTARVSYINIFNRDKLSKEDFGSLSFAVGLKLF